MNDVVLKYLKNKGYNSISTNYYNWIELWENWWRNEVEFHKYHDQTGMEREMYSLGMAKKITEDWSSILFTERDEIKCVADNKEMTEKNNKYLEDQIKKIKLYDELPSTIERAMATGTAAAVLRIKNVNCDKNYNLIADVRTKLDIIYIGANQIIPLKVEHGKIIDIAIVSENYNSENKKEFYIEIHKLKYDKKLEKDTYEITNTYLNEQGQEIKKTGIAENYTISSDIPLFSILKPAIANPLNNSQNNTNGLGFSIYGTALDQLKVCDITYHNFAMDFYLGGKKVFYNKKIVKTKTIIVKYEKGYIKEENKEIYPDDIMRQQWVTYGDEMGNFKDNPAVTEYNPELRVEDDVKGIQFALNTLSFKCGLGTDYYRFDGSKGIVTATQYLGDRQDLMDNANKHRNNVNAFVENICKGILLLGRILFKEEVTEECEISVTDKDGFLVDTETEKKEFRQDIAQGIRKPWEYRVKFLGEDEATAKARIADEEIDNIDEE